MVESRYPPQTEELQPQEVAPDLSVGTDIVEADYRLAEAYSTAVVEVDRNWAAPVAGTEVDVAVNKLIAGTVASDVPLLVVIAT